MKINLTNVSIKPSLGGETVTENLARPIAEAIYQNARKLPEHMFAQKLYASEGELEASPEEIKFIEAVLPGFAYFVQEPVLKIIKTQE